jgi:hypothetical protein
MDAASIPGTPPPAKEVKELSTRLPGPEDGGSRLGKPFTESSIYSSTTVTGYIHI